MNRKDRKIKDKVRANEVKTNHYIDIFAKLSPLIIVINVMTVPNKATGTNKLC